MKHEGSTSVVLFTGKWMRLKAYCLASGENEEVIRDRIRDGAWAAGKHYKRTGPRTTYINVLEADLWISNQPDFENKAA